MPVLLRAAYRPREIRTNRGAGPETCLASPAFTASHEIGSPTAASAAAWISRARIGSPRVSRTSVTASRIQPQRRRRGRPVPSGRPTLGGPQGSRSRRFRSSERAGAATSIAARGREGLEWCPLRPTGSAGSEEARISLLCRAFFRQVAANASERISDVCGVPARLAYAERSQPCVPCVRSAAGDALPATDSIARAA